MSVHLIGMGGIGMSGIAQLLLSRGERVSGSDIQENPLLKRIAKMGGQVRIGHAASHLNGAELVVYSSSIVPQNPELVKARNRGIRVLHRGQMLAQMVSARSTIAVAGSHGKSTTTALVGQLLIQAGLDPMVVLGAEVDPLGGNVRSGHGRYAILEADESDGSFLWLQPKMAVITNIDEEHLDYFRNSSEILETYAAFVTKVHPRGTLIGCADDPRVRQILAISKRRLITYGLSNRAQITAVEIEGGAGRSRYRCLRSGKTLGKIQLSIPGIHNVVNSLAVVGLAQSLGIDFATTQAALESYQGARRRFQIHGEVNGVLVVEDYAHHPAEIQATLQAARSWKGRKIMAVFQPHRYSRTRYLLKRFGSSFDLADEVILLPIYAASEDPIHQVTSESLLKEIQACGKTKVSLQSKEEVLGQLTQQSKPGDLILFLGAGSIGGLSLRLVEALKEKEDATSASTL